MPFFDTSSLLACSYGTSALSLESMTLNNQAVVNSAYGRTDTKVTITAECLMACTGDDFSAQLFSVREDLNTDGRDFIVTGLAGQLDYVLLAATCYNGGPHISFLEHPGDATLQRRFTLTINAQYFKPDGDKNSNSYSVTVTTRPDGLRTITWEGEVNGPTTAAYFLGTVRPKFMAAYPNPGWVVDTRYETAQDGTNSKLTYTANARENFGPLPVSGQTKAVDGEMTREVDKDEQHRVTTTVSCDLLVVGDAAALVNFIRQKMPQPVYKEKVSITSVREQRVTASFTALSSGDRSPLLSWTESLRVVHAAVHYELKTYPGTGPILVAADDELSYAVQSGSMTAVAKYGKPPAPIFDTLRAKPEVHLTDVDDVVKKTDWIYEMWLVGAQEGISPGEQPDGGAGGNVLNVMPPDYVPILTFLTRAGDGDKVTYYGGA